MKLWRCVVLRQKTPGPACGDRLWPNNKAESGNPNLKQSKECKVQSVVDHVDGLLQLVKASVDLSGQLLVGGI